ncbi:Gfo/Idh/MocA family oxidoreductase [Alphaproteobacteria bacterium]|nr:Gfo/Idh/MocA family oxidoreductase [Alphaproteobacteria bacterium]
MSVKFGIVGFGLIGQKRAVILQEFGKIQFVCDPNIDDIAPLAGDTVLETDWKRAINNYPVDAIFVSTYHCDLAKIVKYAAGKHISVLVEKPGAIHADDLRSLLEYERVATIRVGYNHRFHPSLLKLREIVNSKESGELLYLRACYGHGARLNYDKEWRFQKQLSGGGELLDQGAHLIDLLLWIFGPGFETQHAMLGNAFWMGEVEDNAQVSLVQKGTNAKAQLSVSWCEWKNIFRIEVMLRDAKIQIDGLGGSYGLETITVFQMKPEMGPPDVTTQTFPQPDTSFRLETIAFLADAGLLSQDDVNVDLATLHGLAASVGQATRTLEIIEDIYRRYQ